MFSGTITAIGEASPPQKVLDGNGASVHVAGTHGTGGSCFVQIYIYDDWYPMKDIDGNDISTTGAMNRSLNLKDGDIFRLINAGASSAPATKYAFGGAIKKVTV